jgi:hypothetical protein
MRWIVKNNKMLLIILLIGISIPVSAKDSVFVYTKSEKSFVVDTNNLYLAIPGTHFSISLDFPYDRWTGIFVNGISTKIEKVDMNLYRSIPEHDAPYFHLEFMISGKKVNPIFCIANLAQPVNVVTYYLQQSGYLDMVNFEYRLRMNENTFIIGKKSCILKNNDVTYNGAILSVSQGKNSFILDSLADSEIYWIGQINNATIPSIIVSHVIEAGYEYRLYRSTNATVLNYEIVSRYSIGGI